MQGFWKGQSRLPLLVFAVILVASAAILGVGLFDFLYGTEPNYCINTFMHPFYQPIPVTSRHSHKYSLLLYRESSVHAPPFNVVPTGVVPVLFIPGNAGSGMQVRSFASEAARVSQRLRAGGKWVNEMIFFATDFKEELSAFDGNLLWAQAEFVNNCIKELLSLVNRNPKGTTSSVGASKVIVIGHSMGGLVARAIFLLPNYVPHSVDTILTLNSPHKTAAIFAHHKVASFYRDINGYWLDQFANNAFENVSLVSVAGSFRDTLIRSELADISWLVPSSNGFGVITTSMPSVRLQIDHTCIVWCNPMVKAVVNTLYNLLDKETKQATLPLARRMKIFRQGFLSPVSGLLGFRLQDIPQLQLGQYPHIEKIQEPPSLVHESSSFTVSNKTGGIEVSFSVTQWQKAGLDHFVLYSSLEPIVDFSLSLNNAESIVDVTEDQSYILVPPSNKMTYDSSKLNRQRQIVDIETKTGFSFIYYIPSDKLQGYDYLSIKIKDTKKPYFFSCEFFKHAVHAIHPPMIPWGKVSFNVTGVGHPMLLNLSVTANSAPPFYPLSVSVIPTSGKAASFFPLFFVHVNNSMTEELLLPSNPSDMQPFSVKFHHFSPLPLYSILLVDPKTTYTVEVSYNIPAAIGQLLRAYGVMALAMAWAVGFLITAYCLSTWHKEGVFPSFFRGVFNQLNGLNLSIFVFLPALMEAMGFRDLLAVPLSNLIAQLPSELLRDHSLKDLGTDVPPLWVFSILYCFAVLGCFVVGTVVYIIRALFVGLFRGFMKLLRRKEDAQQQPTHRPSVFRMLLLVLLVGLAIATHPLIGIAASWLCLLLSSALSVAKNTFQDGGTVNNYQHTLLASSLGFAAGVAPSFIIWLKGGYPLGVWHDSSVLGIVLIVHMYYAGFTFIQQTKKDASQLLRYFMYEAMLVTLFYGLVKWYRVLDLALMQSALFIYYSQNFM